MHDHDPAKSRPHSRRYLGWALFLLTLSYASSFMDRTILSIVQTPMKVELQLSDADLGLLSGFAFAMFYSVLGLPVARLAERRSRVKLITVSLLAWSVMTALCGTARSFGALFLWRMGVGIGEAGASPPAQSLIADYFPPSRRAAAFSIDMLGVAGGVLVGSVAGGYVATWLGWRAAFVIFGVPGIPLAIVIALTLREPRRGGADPDTAFGEPPSLADVLRHCLARPAMLHLAAGACLTAFAGYAINAFSAPYLIRAFGLSLPVAGLVLGLSGGVSAGIGTLLGGLVTDRLVRREVRWYVWVPTAGLLVATPLYAAAFMASGATLAIALLMAAPLAHYIYIGPTYGVLHNMLHPQMRATATALMYLVINLVGLGVGPPLIGFASDRFAASVFRSPGADFRSACPGGVARAAGTALDHACRAASAQGVGAALVCSSLVLVWGALHYALAARTIKHDLVAQPVPESAR